MATPFSGESAKLNANESTADGEPQSGGSSSSSTSTAGSVALETSAWSVLGAAIAGGMAIL